MNEPDLSPASVEGRLKTLAERSRQLRTPAPVDMSAEAVGRRLRTLSSLHRACTILLDAGRRAGLARGPAI